MAGRHLSLLLLLVILSFVPFLPSVNLGQVKGGGGGGGGGQPEVTIDSGRVRGVAYSLPHLGASGEAFLGIPFAQPPVGPLRFQLPLPVARWSGVLNATALPNSCHQVPDTLFGSEFHGSNMWNPNTDLSEDCLYLSVWVPSGGREREPAGPSSRKRPVMVWIFGGGFYSGTTTLDVYDGRTLAAARDVVVVSVGYRVGALGFLCLDRPSAPCNVGLFDQRLALDWVQRNVAAFGGDARNVTLFGESAGAVSVSVHLLSPPSWDLFHRAIMQSGTANMPWATLTLAEAKRRSVELAVEYMRCPSPAPDEDADDAADDLLVDCLRKVAPEKIVEEQWVSRDILQFPFLPVVDGNFLPEPPLVALRSGRFKKCPVLLGSNANEGSWFIIYELYPRLSLDPSAATMTRDHFNASVEKLFYSYPQYPQKLNSSFALDAIRFQYTDWLNPDDSRANLRAIDAAVADAQFLCPVNEFARHYALHGQTVYSYLFSHRYSSNPWPEWMGVLHGDEVLFTFGQPLKPGSNFSEEEREFTRTILTYWVNFAQTGDPNSRGKTGRQSANVQWPIHTPEGKHYLELNPRLLDRRPQQQQQQAGATIAAAAPSAVGRGPRANQCAFWNEYLPQLISTTAGIDEKERHWKLQFDEWSTSYIVNWKTEFDRFIRDRKDRCSEGEGGGGGGAAQRNRT